jgi:hypothetical protein
VWWAEQGSNLRPSACKADALPAELSARSRPEGIDSYTSQERVVNKYTKELTGNQEEFFSRPLRSTHTDWKTDEKHFSAGDLPAEKVSAPAVQKYFIQHFLSGQCRPCGSPNIFSLL